MAEHGSKELKTPQEKVSPPEPVRKRIFGKAQFLDEAPVTRIAVRGRGHERFNWALGVSCRRHPDRYTALKRTIILGALNGVREDFVSLPHLSESI